MHNSLSASRPVTYAISMILALTLVLSGFIVSADQAVFAESAATVGSDNTFSYYWMSKVKTNGITLTRETFKQEGQKITVGNQLLMELPADYAASGSTNTPDLIHSYAESVWRIETAQKGQFYFVFTNDNAIAVNKPVIADVIQISSSVPGTAKNLGKLMNPVEIVGTSEGSVFVTCQNPVTFNTLTHSVGITALGKFNKLGPTEQQLKANNGGYWQTTVAGYQSGKVVLAASLRKANGDGGGNLWFFDVAADNTVTQRAEKSTSALALELLKFTTNAKGDLLVTGPEDKPLLSLTTSTQVSSGLAPANAKGSVESILAKRTQAEIIKKWGLLKPYDPTNQYMLSMDIYVTRPSLKAPIVIGKLKPLYLNDGLNAVNFMRYLAGLPSDVKLNEALYEQQQAASLVHAISGKLSHSPKQPAGISDDIFKLALKGSNTSNLSYGSETIYESVIQYMSDSDAMNIEALGHRRWLLNPRMQKTMFGFVRDSKRRAYSSLYTFDQSRGADEVIYDTIGWPSAGYFPKEIMRPSDAWSVSLNPKKYQIRDKSGIVVTVKRLRDQKIWKLSEKTKDKGGNYFNVNTSGYGVPLCILFKPSGITNFGTDTYTVVIDGVKDLKGKSVQLRYETKFFTMIK